MQKRRARLPRPPGARRRAPCRCRRCRCRSSRSSLPSLRLAASSSHASTHPSARGSGPRRRICCGSSRRRCSSREPHGRAEARAG
eukprot:4485637-Prymnesium_polylepis.1